MNRDKLKAQILECRLVCSEPFGRFKIQQRLTPSGQSIIVLWMGEDGFEVYTPTPMGCTETARLLGFLPADQDNGSQKCTSCGGWIEEGQHSVWGSEILCGHCARQRAAQEDQINEQEMWGDAGRPGRVR